MRRLFCALAMLMLGAATAAAGDPPHRTDETTGTGSELMRENVGKTTCCEVPVPVVSQAHPLRTWVKRHPAADAARPSPRMGYETSYGYDPLQRLLVRHAGHNQGGGGEQNAETWTYDLDKDEWTLKLVNDAPPGTCCCQQNVFDEAAGRFVRFRAFSGSHGWQSWREIHLKNGSAWTYDVRTNRWLDMRPCPAPRITGLRGAAYDPHHQVIVIHGGETADYGTVAYDLYANTWHRLNPPPPHPESGISQPGFTYDAANRLFVLFGSQFRDDERTWTYDLRRNRWQVLQLDRHPPGAKSCPVLAADTRNGLVLCSVMNGEAHETWVLDVARKNWQKLDVPEELRGGRSRNRVLLYLPDRNLFVMELCTQMEELKEQQIWTFRLVDAPPLVSPPRQLRLKVDEKAVSLSWQPPDGTAPQHYTVYRGEGPTPWQADMKPIAQRVTTTGYRDEQPPGSDAYYQVCAVGADGRQSPPSLMVRVRPPVVTDVAVWPETPKRCVVQCGQSLPDDVVGYHVERADATVYPSNQIKNIHERFGDLPDTSIGKVRAIGPFTRLTRAPFKPAGNTTSFVDESVDLSAGQAKIDAPVHESALRPDQMTGEGGPAYPLAVYAYRVIAVNRLGAESGPSPLVFSFPSAVQQVFAKEEGETATRLRWAPNREPSVAGYVVYRHDGRYQKDRITRLTPKPIAECKFLDTDAGGQTRRYEVSAVDRFGQEGPPSQPVWSRREWQRYYVPYVGQWHQ